MLQPDRFATCMSDLISFDAASFRQKNQPVLTNLTWTLQADQQWAVVGPVGAGKTSFLLAVAGKLHRTTGTASWQLNGTDETSYTQLRREVVLVNFKEESRLLAYNQFFYQQRYHAGLDDKATPLRDFLFADVLPSAHATALLDRLRLTALLDLAFTKLSNGQMRRALLAHALLRKPRLLLLDYPFSGLDTYFRGELTALLTDIMAGGNQVILVTDADALPDSITHVLELHQGSITYAGPRSGYQYQRRIATVAELPDWRQPVQKPDFDVAFALENVTVRHGGKLILNQVNWTVQRGEKWALIGPNGAGKSVLLSLLYGDHPQAYANTIRLFDRPRGWGESIWDIKKRIGFVSPELHLYFHQPLSCRAVALSGLTDTLTPPRAVPDDATHDCEALFRYFAIDMLADRLFQHVSTGQQRLVLLIRALLKRPSCLILDEPFQALDPVTMQRARHLLTTLMPEQTLLFVTHYPHEIPPGITHYLNLDNGNATVSVVPYAQ